MLSRKYIKGMMVAAPRNVLWSTVKAAWRRD